MAKQNKPAIRFKGFADAWEQRKLDDVVEFLDTMRKPLEGAKRISGSYPYYGASGIVDYVDGYLFDEELILLSEDGANITDRNYPVCFLASGKYWVNNHAHVLQTKQGNENNFICNSLERKDYTQYNTGMAMPKLNKETCKKIPISCPEFEEQKKIGDYFRSLDHLITLHQRKYDKLQVLKKAMLEKMFPKNGSSVPEIRFKGFTDAWEQRKFSELYEKVSKKNDLTYGKNDIISVANMYFKPDAYITDDSYLLTYNIFELGDIAFEGNKSKNYAHGRFVENTIGNGIVSHVFDVFKPIMSPYDLLFWKYAINNEGLMGQILLRSTKASTMMTNLVANDFLQEKFFVPSYPEQQKIGAFLDQLDHLITLHQRELEKLQNIKKSMLEKMFV